MTVTSQMTGFSLLQEFQLRAINIIIIFSIVIGDSVLMTIERSLHQFARMEKHQATVLHRTAAEHSSSDWSNDLRPMA